MSNNYTTATTCRCCGSDRLIPLFSLGEHYVNDFVSEHRLLTDYADCIKCPIDLDFCDGCGLVQARHAVDMDLLYRGNYWYTSGRTQTMRDALKDVVRSAMRACPLSTGDVVLDIGSNDGTLLRNYPAEMVRVGVEPAKNLATDENYEGLVLVKDLWNSGEYYRTLNRMNRTGTYCDHAKIVTACGMFYDLVDPNQFIADIAKVLHHDGVFVAQLMCLKQTMEQMDVGNFCHEHLEFYSLSSLHNLLRTHGLGIFNIEENDVNGGSYRLYCCHRESKGVAQTNEMKGRCVDAFARENQLHLGEPKELISRYQDMLRNAQELKAFLLKEKQRGARIFIMGASTKGNTILQFCQIDYRIVEGAADKDPAKWGRYMVGSDIPIMSLEAMRRLDPDYVLVLPYAFRAEMMELEKDQTWRKRGGRFVFPLPKLEVV